MIMFVNSFNKEQSKIIMITKVQSNGTKPSKLIRTTEIPG